MVKPICPVMVNLQPTKSSIVVGSPGVARSIPRIDATIQLRSINGQPFNLRSVGLELRTLQKIKIPSTLGSNESVHETKVYEDPFIFTPTFGSFTEQVLGLDIPILIPLPRDITSSGFNFNWNACTVHNLLVKVSIGDSVDNENNFLETFAIPIKSYDSLPIYRQFTELISELVISNDQQLIVEYNLQESCIGPHDTLRLKLKIMKNSLNYNVSQKIKLKQVNFHIKEILECHQGGLTPYKDLNIHEIVHDEKTTNLNLNNEVNLDYNFKLPLNADFLTIFEDKANSPENIPIANSSNVPIEINNKTTQHQQYQINAIEGIPVTHYQSFTNAGKLFSIRYEISIKLKLVHGKDFSIKVPIIISPYNKKASEYVLTWIIDECKRANQLFGRDIINQSINMYNLQQRHELLKKFTKPPKVYKFNKTDWAKLGFSIDSFGSPLMFIQYID